MRAFRILIGLAFALAGGASVPAAFAGGSVILFNNQTANASFETNTAGWATNQVTASSTTDALAPDGTRAAKLTYTGTGGQSNSSYALDDAPDSIPATQAGQLYTGRVYVRTGSGSKDVGLTIREYDSSNNLVGYVDKRVTASSGSYAKVEVSYTAQGSGNHIGVHVWRYGSSVTSGEILYVDAFSLASNLIPANNQTANASFETNTAGWATNQVTASSTTDALAPDGTRAAKLTYTGTGGQSNSSYALDDAPDSIPATQAGQLYTGRVYVRTGSGSKDVGLTIREYDSSNNLVGYVDKRVTASSGSYAKVEVSYTAQGSGNHIGVHVWRYGSSVTSGEILYVDAFSLASNLIPANNQTANASFETNTAGWATNQVTASSTTDALAPDGTRAAKLTYTGTGGQSNSSYALDDAPDSIPATQAGQLYTGRVYVRTGSGSKDVGLTIREYDSSNNLVGYVDKRVTASSGSYAKVEVSYTAQGSGNHIGVHVWRYGSSVTSGEILYVDAFSLTPATVLNSDTGQIADPLPFWGSIDCADASRQTLVSSGGDVDSTADGTPQGNSAYRHLTVVDGDEVSGERCELGQNYAGGPTAFYHQGERRVTFISVRLSNNFALNATAGTPDSSVWQVVMQMKQAQPTRDCSYPPLALEARAYPVTGAAQWTFLDWSATAVRNQWVRFAFDIYYSKDATGPDAGWAKVYADMDDNGTFETQSGTMTAATLKTEPSSAQCNGVPNGSPPPGSGIPSHLRAGIYHCSMIGSNRCTDTDGQPWTGPDPYPCPAPDGCSIDIDNVQVQAPPP